MALPTHRTARNQHVALAAAIGVIAGSVLSAPGATASGTQPRASREQASPVIHLASAPKLAPPLPAVTEDVMWKKYNEYGVTAYTRGSLPEAARMFRSAFKALRKTAKPDAALVDSNDLRLATVMTNLGAVYRDMGKDDSAEQLLKAAIEIKRRQLKSNDPSLLVSLKHYAKLLSKTHRETEGELLDSRAEMIAWAKHATPDELRLAEQWSPRPDSPFVQVASQARSTRKGPGFDPWTEFDDWVSQAPDERDGYGWSAGDFEPKRLVFRGLSPNDPDVPTWKARVSMERRAWNGQVYPVTGNGPPFRPGSGSGECDDLRGVNRYANPPVVIAPWTTPIMAGRPVMGFGGAPGIGFGGGFGGSCGHPTMGMPAGMPAPMRSLGSGGRWR